MTRSTSEHAGHAPGELQPPQPFRAPLGALHAARSARCDRETSIAASNESVVAPRPAGGRAVLPPPSQPELELRVAPQPGGALRRSHPRPRATAGRRCRRRALLLRPRDEPRPSSASGSRARCRRWTSASAARGGGGIRNERPGCRKTSTIAMTSASGASQIAASSAIDVGRRMPRGSVNVSVSALNIRSVVPLRDFDRRLRIRLLGVPRQRVAAACRPLRSRRVDRLRRALPCAAQWSHVRISACWRSGS